MDWWNILESMLTPIAVMAGGWLVQRVLKKPKDWERANTAQIIAQAAAAQLVRELPDARWDDLVQRLVSIISDQLRRFANIDNHANVQRIAEEAILKAKAMAQTVEKTKKA